MAHDYVIVGAGRMGRAVLWYLKKHGDADIVIVVDTDVKVLADCEGYAKRHGLDDNVHFVLESRMAHNITKDADSFNGVTLNALKGMDVCIATCGYDWYVELTEMCIRTGTSLVDLGGNRSVVEEQRALSQNASDKGIVVVPDCGLAPGMVGVLGMHAFDVLQEMGCKMIDIHMRVGGLPLYPEDSSTNPLRYTLTWSADGLINEYVIPADELVEGQLHKIEPLTGWEKNTYAIDFKNIDYALEAFVTGGGSSNLPELLCGKANNVDYKTIRYVGHHNVLIALKRLGLFSGSNNDAIDYDGPTPREMLTHLLEKNLRSQDNRDIVLLRVTASGYTNTPAYRSKCIELVCTYDDESELTAMAQTTGFSAGAMAHMIADLTIPKTCTGVRMGEEITPAEEFIKRLKKAGLVFT